MQAMEQTKILIRKLMPSRFGFRGDYPSWAEAQRVCSGYDAANILEKVKTSMLKVKSGEAVYERDSVLFDEIEYSWPLLAALMWVAAQKNGKLKVMDFGGSLGSAYFQNQKFFRDTDLQKWSVVEQESFVRCGSEFFEDGVLGFYNEPEEVIRSSGVPDVLLVSCTLPYLEQPYEVLHRLMNLHCPYIVVDNTYFNYETRDRICIQKVPPEIYDASYPCWFLNFDRVLQTMRSDYTIISEHNNESAIYLDGRKIRYKGFLAKLNKY
jgi:putative methyltransferase (TIGR04325 family)